MKRILLFATVAVLFAACKEQNTPTPGGWSGGSTPTETITAYADFAYTTQQPLTVVINGKSKGRSVSYDFGDGGIPEKHGVTDKVAHRYAQAGTYKIRADVSGDNNTSDSYTISVTLSAPKVYIDGIKYLSVDEDGEYYKAILEEEEVFTNTTVLNTNYTPILNNSRLPYEYILANPKLMGSFDDDGYILYIYHSTKGGSDGGTQCLKQNISKNKFLSYPEYIQVSNNSGHTKVQLTMHYE